MTLGMSSIDDERDLNLCYENEASNPQPYMLAITAHLSAFLSVVASPDRLCPILFPIITFQHSATQTAGITHTNSSTK